MKIKSILLSIPLCISLLFAGEVSSFEPPLLALKLLAETKIEKCPDCALEKQKRAFRMLDSDLKEGRTINSGNNAVFIRNNDCDDGELLISSYSQRMTTNDNYEKKNLDMPLITFYFHTKRHHFAGTKSGYFTGDKIDTVYGESKIKNVKTYTGRISIIPCSYGDGKTFIYFARKNKIQVHCNVIELKEVKSK
jgi:hypothetical protein